MPSAGAVPHADRALATCPGAAAGPGCSFPAAALQERAGQVGAVRQGVGALGRVHAGMHRPAGVPRRGQGGGDW